MTRSAHFLCTNMRAFQEALATRVTPHLRAVVLASRKCLLAWLAPRKRTVVMRALEKRFLVWHVKFQWTIVRALIEWFTTSETKLSRVTLVLSFREWFSASGYFCFVSLGPWKLPPALSSESLSSFLSCGVFLCQSLLNDTPSDLERVAVPLYYTSRCFDQSASRLQCSIGSRLSYQALWGMIKTCRFFASLSRPLSAGFSHQVPHLLMIIGAIVV